MSENDNDESECGSTLETLREENAAMRRALVSYDIALTRLAEDAELSRRRLRETLSSLGVDNDYSK